MASKKKVLLMDRLLEEGWFENEKQAQSWIMERKVLVKNELAYSGKILVSPTDPIRVKDYEKSKYASRGGYKLEGALKAFHISAEGKVVLDCGASTGGFSDCLLQNGAACVYAVDVGYGQIAGKVSTDPRVVNMERTNLSDQRLLALDPRPEMITLDLSYLSLKKALPICRDILHEDGKVVALVKPLFEVESSDIRRSGEINDRETLKSLLLDLCESFDRMDFGILGATYSPIRGNNGTIEYFLYIDCKKKEGEGLRTGYQEEIERIVEASFEADMDAMPGGKEGARNR